MALRKPMYGNVAKHFSGWALFGAPRSSVSALLCRIRGVDRTSGPLRVLSGLHDASDDTGLFSDGYHFDPRADVNIRNQDVLSYFGSMGSTATTSNDDMPPRFLRLGALCNAEDGTPCRTSCAHLVATVTSARSGAKAFRLFHSCSGFNLKGPRHNEEQIAVKDESRASLLAAIGDVVCQEVFAGCNLAGGSSNWI